MQRDCRWMPWRQLLDLNPISWGRFSLAWVSVYSVSTEFSVSLFVSLLSFCCQVVRIWTSCFVVCASAGFPHIVLVFVFMCVCVCVCVFCITWKSSSCTLLTPGLSEMASLAVSSICCFVSEWGFSLVFGVVYLYICMYGQESSLSLSLSLSLSCQFFFLRVFLFCFFTSVWSYSWCNSRNISIVCLIIVVPSFSFSFFFSLSCQPYYKHDFIVGKI